MSLEDVINKNAKVAVLRSELATARARLEAAQRKTAKVQEESAKWRDRYLVRDRGTNLEESRATKVKAISDLLQAVLGLGDESEPGAFYPLQALFDEYIPDCEECAERNLTDRDQAQQKIEELQQEFDL